MKKIIYLIIIPVLLILTVSAFTNQKATKITEKKENRGFAVIELFTSEGCSSCPPADDAIAEIQKEYKDKNVLVLGFHVDYWDRLGWKDPFSSSDFTARQEYYASIFNLNSIYTPEAVINGKSEFVGSDKNKIINNVEGQLKLKSKVSITLKAMQNNSGKIEINYSVEDNNSRQDQLVILLIQKNASDNIKKGENEGKTLQHINIVRKMSCLSVPLHEANFTFNLSKDFKKEYFFIAAFVQNKKHGDLEGLGIAEIN
ncbi:MAG TPA: DUF1223 domain-containing protein [Chitinophagaceae bacterium]|nr:DUF1223 domain-containing protein [Chitinophagaceae bacterium]